MPGEIADICRRVAVARNKEAAEERNYRISKYRIENSLRAAYRNDFLGKKPTEDAIKMEVALDPSVMAAQSAVLEAQAETRLLEAELAAYTCKRDMIVSLSAYLRSEIETTRFSNTR